MNHLRMTLTRLFCNVYATGLLCLALWFGAPSMSEGLRQMVSFAIVNMLLAQSINLLTGMAGQISLCQAAFMGIAAYASVLLVKNGSWPLWASLPAGVLLASFAGYLLSFPAGRVREFYLAMMTLGFGMMFVEIVREWNDVTGGVMGVVGVPSPQLRMLSIFGHMLTTTDYLRLLICVAAAALFMLDRFTRSRFGRAYLAIHVSEVSARSIGIDSAAVKRQAYVISAGLAGLAGGLYGHLVSYIGPESFELHRSIEILVISVVGGLGSLAGQVIGAVALTWLPTQLEAFADYKFIAYGAVLVAIFVVMPRGLAGLLFLPPRFISRRLLGEQNAVAGSSAFSPSRSSEPKDIVLAWNGLRRDFAGLTAVRDFSFSLRAGEVVALVGPNGSGKSTTVNVLAGIYPPSAGTVLLKGADISGLASHAIAQRGLVRTFQDPRLVGSFTVLENVMLGGHLGERYSAIEAATGLGRAMSSERSMLARARETLRFMELEQVADNVLDTLPYGYRRLVEVARAMMVMPEVLLLDEPAAGLSEGEIDRLSDVIGKLSRQGTAILIIDHHMDFLAGLVDQVVVLDSGEEIYRGDMAGMRNDARVAECYLGRVESTHA
ncbi:ABC transporter permease subunit [Bosea sp. (in: a-proteobacteria)]|uniref:branched-chain amino acid ABC transporter ATP-binding protein/permease n=1 Tax=Bosea sp. (in: a-proteobacteria) TaxID=1871050 RepID=UPI003B3AE8FA